MHSSFWAARKEVVHMIQMTLSKPTIVSAALSRSHLRDYGTFMLAATILTLWLTTIYSPIVESLKQHTMLYSRSKRTLYVTDTVKFYEVGSLAANPATRLHVYDPAVQVAWARDFFGPGATRDRWYAEYVPFLFPLMIPFSRLPLESLSIVWTISSVLAGVLSLTVLAKLASIGRLRWLLCLAALFASLPCWSSIVLGQITLFLLLTVSYFCWGFFCKDDFIGGIALALSAVKPHYALFLAIPAVAKKRWHLIAVAFVFEIFLLIAAVMSIGWGNVLGYPQTLMHSELLIPAPENEACVRGLLGLLLPPSLAFPSSVIAWMIGLALTVRLWITAREERSMRWAMTLTIMLMLWFSPHTNLYDWTLLWASGMVTQPIREETGSMTLWHHLIACYPVLSWVVFVSAAVAGSIFNSASSVNLLHFLLILLALRCFGQSCVKNVLLNHYPIA
jgi:hypothetical protein